jgi:hypothetical protein
MKATRAGRRFLALKAADKAVLGEAAVIFVLFRVATKTIPLSRLTRWLDLRPVPLSSEEGLGTRPKPQQASHCAWAVDRVASYLPVTGTCLPEALATAIMLRRRHIPCTMYLGVMKASDAPSGMAAHAWLRCETSSVVIGARPMAFTTVGAFECRPRIDPVIAKRPPAGERVKPHRLRRGLMLQQELRAVLGELRSAGVDDPIVLKGVPLAIRVFGSVGSRRMADIDLVVKEEDLPAALKALGEYGYQREAGEPDLVALRELLLTRMTELGELHVDLHWRIWQDGFATLSEDEVWRRTEPFSYQGIECRVLEPMMTILHLAYHDASHQFQHFSMVRDFAQAWNQWGEAIDPAALGALADETSTSTALAVAFRRALEAELLEIPAPKMASGRAAVVIKALHGPLGRSEFGRKLVTLLIMRPEGVAHRLVPTSREMRAYWGHDEPLLQLHVNRTAKIATKVLRADSQKVV